MKDQQAGINDKLDEECFSLEEEINSLRLEVSVIIVVSRHGGCNDKVKAY